MKRTASRLLLIFCLLLSGCSFNLYEKTGLITPSLYISLDYDTVNTGDSGFDLYDLTYSATEYTVSIPPAEDRNNLEIIKMLDEDSEWRLIEALEYHSKAGTLEAYLGSELPADQAVYARNSLAYLASLYLDMADQVGKVDTYIQNLILQLTSTTGVTLNVTVFKDICNRIDEAAARLEDETITMDDYLVIQYSTNLIGALLEASVPVVATLADTSKILTEEAVKELLDGEALPEDSIEILAEQAEELTAILLRALAMMDQIGRYTDGVPSVAELLRRIGEATGK